LEKGLDAFRFGVLTVSDTRCLDDDLSGQAIEDSLLNFGAFQIERSLCRDEIEEIQREILDLASRCDVVLTTGGTGFHPRDKTPEATAALLDRCAENLSEYIRLSGCGGSHQSYFSRGVAGVRGDTLIINLPGSPSGAREGVEALSKLLPHILSQLHGESEHSNP
jgi:molybdopterin adenylyltransferase